MTPKQMGRLGLFHIEEAILGVLSASQACGVLGGRNQLGEPVASGVYFCTLTAGDFTATRKMLIQTISKIYQTEGKNHI